MLLVGRLALALALVLSGASAALLVAGVRRGRRDLVRHGYAAAYGVFLAAALAAAVLLLAFLDKDFSFQYVWENSDTSLSAFYRIAGFWAGQQGSFLLWGLLLAGVAALIAVRDARRSDGLTAGAVAALVATAGFFVALMVFDRGSNPFVANPLPNAPPAGLNPLLLHPAMVLHPPALFLGYAGLAAPFAFAVSALWQRRADAAWVVAAQRWAVAGWLFLSLGIGLGAWWAYVILSWGGYWGWDPVENTSLVPWLTATALLHSFALYRRRAIFKRWAAALALGTFWLTLVATWTTRTDLINSVHAFAGRTLLVVVLSCLVVVVAALAVCLLAWRWRAFAGDGELESYASRDFLHYVTNVGLTAFAVAILFATVIVPLVFKQSVRPVTYDALARPLGVLTLLGLAVCPLLEWRRTGAAAVLRRLALPAGTALLALFALAFTGAWAGSLGGLLSLTVCAFAGAAVLESGYLRARRAARDDGLLTGLGRFLGGRRSRSAALVAHLGMALTLAGLVGSNMYKVERRVAVPAEQGASTAVSGYTLAFKGYRQGSSAQQSQQLRAAFTVTRNGRPAGAIEPRLDYYPATGQTTARAVIVGGAFEDLFVSPQSFDDRQVVLQLDVFPLMRFVWVGATMLVLGAAVSLWPQRRAAGR